MSSHTISIDFFIDPVDKNRLAFLIGPEDENLKLIEKRLNVKISYSGAHFQINGTEHKCNLAKKIINQLYLLTKPTSKNQKVNELSLEDVHLCLSEHKILEQEDENTDSFNLASLYEKANTLKTKKGMIRGRTSNQSSYIQNILTHDVNFGIGPAGTGKTYLAVACAVSALERNEVRRIILTRPAVEAGEKLGFLPGDLSQKVDPYLRPLYDALFEMLGFEKVEKLIEKQIIEIAPLAYMRGRTLNDSFIILDEAQNTTIEQMKMFLTRIGFNSKAVITGDPSQIDLPRHISSGLKHAVNVLKDIPSISISNFFAQDVVRHPVVAAIVDAYERFENLNKSNEND